MYDKNMTRFKVCNEMPVIRPYTLANPVQFKIQRKQGTFYPDFNFFVNFDYVELMLAL